MSMQVQPAPALREKRARPPQIMLRPAEVPRSSRLAVGLSLALAVAGGLGAWMTLGPSAADPHYLTARRLVDTYERGRTPEGRNYNHPVYAQALAELEQVDPSSGSADDAATLAGLIRDGMSAFAKRMQQREAQFAAQREKKREADERVFQAREHALLNPVTSYPECEEGSGHSHARGGHDH